jgi:4-carboxymuconolactone decarboxylase
MSRVEGLSREAATLEVQSLYADLEERFGVVLESVAVSARSPKVLNAVLGFERGIRTPGALDRRLRSLIELRVSTHLGCSFCIDLGSYLSQQDGASEREVLEIGDFRTSDAFSERDRAALEYALSMSGTRSEVSDALFERVRRQFSDEEILEITAVAAWENFRGRFNRALGLQAHGFTAGSVCAMPDVD